jgi:hypothetical protein
MNFRSDMTNGEIREEIERETARYQDMLWAKESYPYPMFADCKANIKTLQEILDRRLNNDRTSP